jgi:hypothetical protein
VNRRSGDEIGIDIERGASKVGGCFEEGRYCQEQDTVTERRSWQALGVSKYITQQTLLV